MGLFGERYLQEENGLYGNMRLLYKDQQDVTMTVHVEMKEGLIVLDFSSDCGKFGTDEMLDGYTLTPERLLQILQERDDITDEENDS